MSTRTILAALCFLAATAFDAPLWAAIDADQIIEPRQSTEAAGQGAQDDEAMQGLFSNGDASFGAMISILGYVLIVGALAVAVWYLFKRGMIRKPFAKGEGKLKIAETRMLGNRQFIMVVEYEQQKLLLGVGPGKIDYLTNLSGVPADFSQLDQMQVKNEGGAQ
ncbi:flagellar biosynthetic protein FliO [Pelagicoccus sp. SDUM812003]|uniref:FliO/MopB family protein n=1 Tax=Pelagicoccus sp. SDUM812003 TaxID=3041267 RepID=UPI00280C4130|nr:flagellar biosynthetic protein FliO [Pelagicoccus sp. SDUM812003]MDQ8202542.1 flagellar biosynthetic protein FliO [Pelagicoccus sp. SDUM812003]